MSIPSSSPFLLSIHLLVLFVSLLVFPASAIDLPEGVVLGDVDDWLIHDVAIPVTLEPEASQPLTCRVTSNPKAVPCLRLTNGLISRTFALSPAFGTVDFYSHSSRRSLLRTLQPEATLSLDGLLYRIGGLQLDPATKPERAYANRTAWNLTADPLAWIYVNHTIATPEALYPWTPGIRHSPTSVHWPPLGLHLTVTWAAPASARPAHRGLLVQTHYEMYQGIPAMAQWLTVNSTQKMASPVLITAVQVLSLATNQEFSPLAFASYPSDPPTINDDVLSRLYVATDQAHSTLVRWYNDPAIGGTPGAAEPELNVTYESGPGVLLSSASTFLPVAAQPSFSSFTSFRAFLLVTDSIDRERHGLSVRGLTRRLAPATLESPIFFHGTNASSAGIRSAVDQMSEVGFEMLILSFGTSFDLESQDPAYLDQMKADIAYAHQRGIEVGGYDLIVWTRDVGEAWDAISPDTNKTHGDACIASGWFDQLLERAVTFITYTGLSAVETDGPYPGYPCASTNHSHHVGLTDSIYQNTRLQGEFFHQLRSLNVYIHQPDEYFYQGGSKSAMGYNEDQYSLPRWTDLTISRQGMYEDTFLRTPTQGWMFLPLQDYHGGGSEAAFEPLSDHLSAYEWALAQYLGAGVGACYRGNRLYDTNATRSVVGKWVSFYKKHRAILSADLIHVRRADLQGLDSFLHADAGLDERGLLMLFNPTQDDVNTTIAVPLYYAGLTEDVWVQEREGEARRRSLDRLYNLRLPVVLSKMNFTWFLFRSTQPPLVVGPPTVSEAPQTAAE